MAHLKKILSEAIESIDTTTGLFYQQKNKEGYQSLNETLTILIQTVDLISKTESENVKLNIDVHQINLFLENAMKAMQQKDTILLSDILSFDIKNSLNNI